MAKSDWNGRYTLPEHSEAAVAKTVGHRMAKCAIPSCNVRVNSRRKIFNVDYPVCTIEHREEMALRILNRRTRKTY